VSTQSNGDQSRATGVALEQYRLAVETADRLSGRRQSANAFFLSVVSALTVANGTNIVSEWYWTCTVSTVTMLACFMWCQLLASYRAINSAKFKVIHQIEAVLPFAVFANEEAIYQSTKRTGYRPLSRIEQAVPALFAIPSFAITVATVVDQVLP